MQNRNNNLKYGLDVYLGMSDQTVLQITARTMRRLQEFHQRYPHLDLTIYIERAVIGVIDEQEEQQLQTKSSE